MTASDWSASRTRWELDPRPADVLLIGSQVAFGSVGMNGVLPQLSDARVVPLPTIVLGNLPHYPSVHTTEMPAAWLQDVIGYLDALGVLDEIDSVCTGYFASPGQVIAVADALEPVLSRRPGLRVVVDPTLGDADVGFYTDPAVAPALRERMLPLATGIVPNRFELHTLGDDDHDPVAAARALFGERTQWAIVSGGTVSGGDSLIDLLVTRAEAQELRHPLLATTVKGAGDVFAGALLAALRSGASVMAAAAAASAAVREVIAPRGSHLPS